MATNCVPKQPATVPLEVTDEVIATTGLVAEENAGEPNDTASETSVEQTPKIDVTSTPASQRTKSVAAIMDRGSPPLDVKKLDLSIAGQDWLHMFERLKKFLQDCPQSGELRFTVPASYDARLQRWVRTQRERGHAKTPQRHTRWVLLDSVGFWNECHRPSKNGRRVVRTDEQGYHRSKKVVEARPRQAGKDEGGIEERYEKAQTDYFGETKRKYHTDYNSNKRQKAVKKELAPSKDTSKSQNEKDYETKYPSALDKDKPYSASPGRQWFEMFGRLKEFVEGEDRQGSFKFTVPLDKDEENKKLGYWVHRQRKEFFGAWRQGDLASITPMLRARWNLLDTIGFWDPQNQSGKLSRALKEMYERAHDPGASGQLSEVGSKHSTSSPSPALDSNGSMVGVEGGQGTVNKSPGSESGGGSDQEHWAIAEIVVTDFLEEHGQVDAGEDEEDVGKEWMENYEQLREFVKKDEDGMPFVRVPFTSMDLHAWLENQMDLLRPLTDNGVRAPVGPCPRWTARWKLLKKIGAFSG